MKLTQALRSDTERADRRTQPRSSPGALRVDDGPSSKSAKWDRRCLGLLAAVLIVRIAYTLLDATDLSPDEAYYWDWSRHLDWCYYSKPPIVAWVMRLSTELLGHSTSAVRLPAALLSAGSLAGTATLARLLFGSRTAFWTLALAAASPGASALGMIMTIDPPVVCAWSWSLVFTWLALQRRGLGYWLAAGATVAVGLMSKQVMLAFPVLALSTMGLVRPWRPRLRSAGPLVMLTVASLAAVPILYWNAQHDWVMFSHSASHARPPAWSLKTFGDFTGAQAGLLSPWTWFLMVVVAARCLRNWRSLDERSRFLWIFGALPLVGIHGLSLWQRTHANWSAPFYPAIQVLCAAWLCGQLEGVRPLTRPQRHLRGALTTGVALCLILYAVPWIAPRLTVGGSRQDPTQRVRGWQQTAEHVHSELQRAPAPSNTIVVSTSRQTTAELAFYMPGAPRVYRFPEKRVTSQYDVLGGPTSVGLDALIVENARDPLPQAVRDAFTSVEPFGSIEVPLGRGGGRHLVLYLARGLRSWPPSMGSAR